jgi:hypothetical protein
MIQSNNYYFANNKKQLYMNKLTVKEILDIIESNMSVEEFAFNDYPVPDDFTTNSDEEKKIELEYQINQDNYYNHPGYKDSSKIDEEYDKIRDIYFNTPSPYKYKREKWLESLGLGKIEEVDQYGGEGQGDTWYSVKYFVDHDVYIKTNGHYSSYNGTEFYDGYGEEVKPVEKTIIEYI